MMTHDEPIGYVLADPADDVDHGTHPVHSTVCQHGTGAGLRAGLPTDLVEWRIAVRCRACGSWLTDPRSVMAGIGPRCAQGVR